MNSRIYKATAYYLIAAFIVFSPVVPLRTYPVLSLLEGWAMYAHAKQACTLAFEAKDMSDNNVRETVFERLPESERRWAIRDFAGAREFLKVHCELLSDFKDLNVDVLCLDNGRQRRSQFLLSSVCPS